MAFPSPARPWWQEPLVILARAYRGEADATDAESIERLVRWKWSMGFDTEHLILNRSMMEGEGGAMTRMRSPVDRPRRVLPSQDEIQSRGEAVARRKQLPGRDEAPQLRLRVSQDYVDFWQHALIALHPSLYECWPSPSLCKC